MTILFLFLFVIALLLILLLSGCYFQQVAFFPKRYSRAETMRMEIDSGKIKSFEEVDSWPHSEIEVQSPNGYTLKGEYYPLPGSTKTIIFSHGITITLKGSAKYLAIFRRLGFNLIVYDNRFHGLSGGPNCSFGILEKLDLRAVVDWAIAQIGPNATIGTHGESLGAAITLQHAAIDPRVAFAISDCGFSDLHQLFRLRLAADYHLPPWPIFPVVGLVTATLQGFNYRQASPIAGLDELTTPILFIHGDQDSYILPAMSEAMFQAKKSGIKRIYFAKGAKHAEAYSADPAEYEKQIRAFLKEAADTNPALAEVHSV